MAADPQCGEEVAGDGFFAVLDGELGGFVDQVGQGGDVAAAALVQVGGQVQQGAGFVLVQVQVVVEGAQYGQPGLVVVLGEGDRTGFEDGVGSAVVRATVGGAVAAQAAVDDVGGSHAAVHDREGQFVAQPGHERHRALRGAVAEPVDAVDQHELRPGAGHAVAYRSAHVRDP